MNDPDVPASLPRPLPARSLLPMVAMMAMHGYEPKTVGPHNARITTRL